LALTMSLHPATLLAAWFVLACMLPSLDGQGLALAWAAALPLLALSTVRIPFLRLLMRTRVLLLALILIYGFATPGLPLFGYGSEFTPTWDGLALGSMQAGRLGLMLLALSGLLALLGRQGMLEGIYGLLLPLRALGVPIERFAVRLWLTLALVDRGGERSLSLSGIGDALAADPPAGLAEVSFELPRPTWRDVVFALLLIVVVGMGAW